MKKSRILSLALTLALVFTTVFAGTESIFAESSNAKLQALGSTVTALEDATGSAGSYDNPIVAKNINTTGDAEI